MIIFKKKEELINHLQTKKKADVQIGFIPTMGALHAGHLSLMEQSKKKAGMTVCSIFVNPTQFNDQKDFQKYPVTIENDIYMLETNGVDILFLPAVDEIYPNGTDNLEHYELGYLETILEGKFRPGHFQGVCQVMFRLLEIVKPDFLFMGQKDYQQCMVVKRLLEIMQSNIQFIACETLRETDGLAMSSRNMRLNEGDRKNATGIYEALIYLQQNIKISSLIDIVDEAKSILIKKDFVIDYVEIASADDLTEIENWNGSQKIVALVAALQHEIRLIDNMLLNVEHN
ncbi:MAG TPA: pantoate--beta-alanine ligase [Puia sp.]|jgi:pantoate--beta-alanine ligase|nr:pantoate--beta-alanine ligase [Puia sp.]